MPRAEASAAGAEAVRRKKEQEGAVALQKVVAAATKIQVQTQSLSPLPPLSAHQRACLQALVRRQDARRFLVETYANEGLLLALPGTIQNRSGWYEVPPDEAVPPQTPTRVVRFEVTDSGEWLRVEGPISKVAWRATK